MRNFKQLILPGVLLALIGCTSRTPTVLSGETAYEMQSSIIMLSQNLSPAQRDEFDQAVATIVFSATDRRLNANGDRLTPQAIQMLKGRTVRQVIENAKLMRSVAAY